MKQILITASNPILGGPDNKLNHFRVKANFLLKVNTKAFSKVLGKYFEWEFHLDRCQSLSLQQHTTTIIRKINEKTERKIFEEITKCVS